MISAPASGTRSRLSSKLDLKVVRAQHIGFERVIVMRDGHPRVGVGGFMSGSADLARLIEILQYRQAPARVVQDTLGYLRSALTHHSASAWPSRCVVRRKHLMVWVRVSPPIASRHPSSRHNRRSSLPAREYPAPPDAAENPLDRSDATRTDCLRRHQRSVRTFSRQEFSGWPICRTDCSAASIWRRPICFCRPSVPSR
jgi:hypothetical protein